MVYLTFYWQRTRYLLPGMEFYIEGFERTKIAILNLAQSVEVSPSLDFYVCRVCLAKTKTIARFLLFHAVVRNDPTYKTLLEVQVAT